MLISNLLNWPLVNWPGTSTAAQYSVFQMYPGNPIEIVVVQTNSALLSYDDILPVVFQVRPSSGTNPTETYGPEVMTFVNGFVPCRAYVRQLTRKALADRADRAGVNLAWPDDELDSYIYNSIVELNQLFPVEKDFEIQMVTNQRVYPLPSDLLYISTVEFVSLEGNLHLYLKEKPWRGGESTATTYLGYPKLGLLNSPQTGRFYPGHYYLYEQNLHIDWDPMTTADTQLKLHYKGQRVLPVGDADILQLTEEDVTLVALRTQVFAWLRIEGSDVRLSRWRTKDDGGSRSDLPTVKMSAEIQKLYNGAIIDRKERRPKVLRLVRR
jgi:hypothetical protein